MTSPQNSCEQVSVFSGYDICRTTGLNLKLTASRPKYEDDVWNFTEVIGVNNSIPKHDLVLRFDRIRNLAWRPVAKDLVIALFVPDDEKILALPKAARSRRSIRTVFNRLREWIVWFNWLTDHGITSLSHVSQRVCDHYLETRSWTTLVDGSTRRVSPEYRSAIMRAVIHISFYGPLVLADKYADGFEPWAGEVVDEVAGVSRRGENATPPVPDAILRPLLANCIYLIEVVGPHIVELLHAVRHDRDLQKTRRIKCDSVVKLSDAQVARVSNHIERYRKEGKPLPELDARYARSLRPDWDQNDPLLQLHISRLLIDCGITGDARLITDQIRPILERANLQVGTMPLWGRDAAMVRHAGSGELVPWTLPIHFSQVRQFVSHTIGACMLFTSAVTGMRHSEIAEIQVGARRVTEEIGGSRYRLTSKVVKGQDVGGLPDEWVVVEEVHNAIGLAESLSDPGNEGYLFGRPKVALYVESFRRWCSSPLMQRLGLQPIPEGPVNGRMLRRTLALELAKRPSGLLAAKIHLKHVSVATTEGYAARPGGSQSAFLDEVGKEEASHHLHLTIEAYKEYRAGRLPAGPGARELILAFAEIDSEFELDDLGPPVVMDDRRLADLLRRRAGILHTGPANYCWFQDPAKALCLRLANAEDASRPVVGLCDSAKCPQATHHSHHREIWLTSADSLKIFLDNPRIPVQERERLHKDLERSMRVVRSIEDAEVGGKTDAHKSTRTIHYRDAHSCRGG